MQQIANDLISLNTKFQNEKFGKCFHLVLEKVQLHFILKFTIGPDPTSGQLALTI